MRKLKQVSALLLFALVALLLASSIRARSARAASQAAVPPAFLPYVARPFPTPTPPPPTPPPSGWVTLSSADFESGFPGGWTASDLYPGTGEYFWGRRNCRAYAGGYSGWSIGAGQHGASLSCSANYPNDAESWMVFGPFSLADATAADLKYKMWLNSELGYDGLCRLASVDGTHFSGTCSTGTYGGWIDRTLDLANVYSLGNLMGRQQVWVAIVFTSDYSITRPGGAYVDNIVLRKFVTGAQGTPPAAEPQPELFDSDTLREVPVQWTRAGEQRPSIQDPQALPDKPHN